MAIVPTNDRSRQPVEFTPAPPDQRAPKLSILRQKKPEWNDKAEVWTDLHILYIGGYLIRQNAMRFLWRRPKEDANVYSVRVDHVTYHDLLGTGLGWFGAELFEISPEIGVLQEQLNGPGKKAPDDVQFYYDHKFLKNCDSNGTSFVNFWQREIMPKMLIFGEAWVLTDLPPIPEEDDQKPKTLQEQRNMGLLDPHLTAYTPMQVINYQFSQTGELLWCIIQTSYQEQHFLGAPEQVDRWYYFDQTTYRVYEYRRSMEKAGETTVQVTPAGAANLTIQNAPINQAMASDRDPQIPLIAEGLHALAEFRRCPVRRFVLPDNLWIANRAYLPLLDHFNQDNTLAWALFMANLAMPVIIGDVDLTNQVLSEMGFIQLPEGCSYKWTEPEGKSFAVSQKRVDQLREEIYRSMYLYGLGREQSSTAGASSGFSKQMDFMAASDILDALGEVIIEGMQNMLIDAADARGDEGLVFDVRGFHFEEHVTLQEIETIDKAINMLVPSETFERELYRLVARAFLKDANPELFERIIEEINAGPTRLEREKEMMQFEFDLGLKPGVYNRVQGDRSSGMMVTASGTPGQPGPKPSSDTVKSSPNSGTTKTAQSSAGKLRNSAKLGKGPTTRPSKKAN